MQENLGVLKKRISDLEERHTDLGSRVNYINKNVAASHFSSTWTT